MKTRSLCKSIALLALLTACSTEELTTNAAPTPGQQVTITASLGSSNADADKPGTRMGYEPNTDATVGGLLTKWTANDAFNIMTYNSNTKEEGTPQPFTLDAASIGKTEGTFIGTAPAASSKYVIYYPANKITKKADFLDFSYAGQVQKGNGNPDHLTNYHSIKLETKADYTEIDFSKGRQSSCMKFVLTLLGDDEIVPKTITLASADDRTCFYATNRGTGDLTIGDIASLSMELSDIELTSTERTITAYMMMSYQDVYLSTEGSTVTVEATDGSSYTQFIETPVIDNAYSSLLESGKMHTITAKNMKKVPNNVMTFTVKVTAADNTFSIPFPTSGETPAAMTVNWGEGGTAVEIPVSTALFNETFFNHTYTNATAEGSTYTITITSAQTDATQQQIPEFSFYSYRTNSGNNPPKLISMDTPLLNTGNPEPQYCFYGCSALTTISADLFKNYTKATDFSSCFRDCKALTAIPEGLFDNHTLAKTFTCCFYNCTALKEIPEGLFANNTAAKNFSSCFYNCNLAKLNAKIFSLEGNIEGNTRFSGKEMYFYQCFYGAGYSLTDATDIAASIAPQLWIYAGGGKGTGWTTEGCFTNCYANSSSWDGKVNGWGTPKQ